MDNPKTDIQKSTRKKVFKFYAFIYIYTKI